MMADADDGGHSVGRGRVGQHRVAEVGAATSHRIHVAVVELVVAVGHISNGRLLVGGLINHLLS